MKWNLLKKLKRELPYDPAISLLDMNLKKKNTNSKKMHSNVHCSIIYDSKDMETLMPLMDE